MRVLGSYAAMLGLVLGSIAVVAGYLLSRRWRLRAALRRVAAARGLTRVEGPTELHRGSVNGRVVEMGYRKVPLQFSIVEGAEANARFSLWLSGIAAGSVRDPMSARRDVEEMTVTQFGVSVECSNPRAICATMTRRGLSEHGNLEELPVRAVRCLFEDLKLSAGEALRVPLTGGVVFLREELVRGQVSVEWLEGVLARCLALAEDVEMAARSSDLDQTVGRTSTHW